MVAVAAVEEEALAVMAVLGETELVVLAWLGSLTLLAVLVAVLAWLECREGLPLPD